MVDYSHLSAGNSLSSPSRDLFEEYGVSKPNSPAEPASDTDMGESDPVPVNLLPHPVTSSDSENGGSDIGLPEELQDVFRAAQLLSHKTQEDVVVERRKNQDLWRFITAQGFQMEDVNKFISQGKYPASRSVDDCNIIALESRKTPVSTALRDPPRMAQAPPSSAEPLGDPIPHTSPRSDPAPTKTWSSVVATGETPTLQLDYIPSGLNPTSVGTSGLKPPIDVLKLGNNQWTSCSVGGFQNSKLPFKLVAESAHKLWGKYGLQKVFLQEKGYFVFQFSTPAEMDNVLALGPWYISNKLITLKKWKEGVELFTEACTKTPI